MNATKATATTLVRIMSNHESGTGLLAGSASCALINVVSPGNLRTLRIPLLQGRDFSDRDDEKAAFVGVSVLLTLVALA
ncbi:MAG TPA: hypothetical protein VKB60_06100, partial [Terriglobales bacterium]|nr:hypothetical protein [Terriglobales bacterium]